MSIFFQNERRPKVTVPDLVPDWEAALKRVSKREDAHAVSAFCQLTVEQARYLIQECRRVEPMLLRAIQDGTVTTKTSAVDFIRESTEGFFPAVRFIAVMQETLGGEATPATWAQVVAAAQTEDVG